MFEAPKRTVHSTSRQQKVCFGPIMWDTKYNELESYQDKQPLEYFAFLI